ncbi:serine dehydratase-like isoform X2 [Corythoichthys intestinalis]|uniref:serine dehydratase-like isoform X2 n=1 Tax=Corythoichthys intestinalis TaxID=161448 RepID=UPI0025A4F294|nr:serine dehydratase-like isoform X2 [Corythoichthys intestinalis]
MTQWLHALNLDGNVAPSNMAAAKHIVTRHAKLVFAQRHGGQAVQKGRMQCLASQPSPVWLSPNKQQYFCGRCAAMSKRVGITVYLKMENSQPSGSFKIRGIGYLCQQLASQAKGFVCSSGGNAGMAAAYVTRKMGAPATIIVPSSTPHLFVQRLKDQCATVKIIGKVWDDANAEALRLVKTEGLAYVPPFDHPLIWKGHSSVILEVAASLGPNVKPGAVLTSVGGGGLLCGLVEGLKDAGWMDVPIIAMETVGADCLNASVKAGRIVTLDDITSEAKCLGAKTVCTKAFEYCQSNEIKIISEVVTDQQALHAVETFLDEERVLVEMACGATLAAIYSGVVQRLQEEGRLPPLMGPLLVIVCGGSNIDTEQLSILKQRLQTK